MLELKNICYSIDGKDILKDISLQFDKNIFVITGPNGAGKSTLAKIIMGILQPTSGQILFDGKDITSHSITQRAKLGFAFAFQQPVKFKGLKVADILKIAQKDVGGNTAKHITAVGLCFKDYMQRELSQSLSGGEQKRIEIATVLAREGVVSIFDEPEAGIDLWSFNHLVETFKNFHKKNNGIFIMISHQQKMIDIAHKVVLLEKGKATILQNVENGCVAKQGIKNCACCGVKNG